MAKIRALAIRIDVFASARILSSTAHTAATMPIMPAISATPAAIRPRLRQPSVSTGRAATVKKMAVIIIGITKCLIFFFISHWLPCENKMMIFKQAFDYDPEFSFENGFVLIL